MFKLGFPLDMSVPPPPAWAPSQAVFSAILYHRSHQHGAVSLLTTFHHHLPHLPLSSPTSYRGRTSSNVGIISALGVSQTSTGRLTLSAAPGNMAGETDGAEQGIAGLELTDPMAALSIVDLVDKPPPWDYELCIVGSLLTKQEVNFAALKRRLSNIWQPGRGVEIGELDGRLLLFRFNHSLDVGRVMEDGPWSFKGLLLVTHELKRGELPQQVPLQKIAFWVQIHDLPFGYFSEKMGGSADPET